MVKEIRYPEIFGSCKIPTITVGGFRLFLKWQDVNDIYRASKHISSLVVNSIKFY